MVLLSYCYKSEGCDNTIVFDSGGGRGMTLQLHCRERDLPTHTIIILYYK